jgi:predicted RNase H-like HicB family nuclease
MARIFVIFEKGQSSYGGYAPDVPGCVAVGESREEVEQLREEHHLKVLFPQLPLPQSQTEAE